MNDSQLKQQLRQIRKEFGKITGTHEDVTGRSNAMDSKNVLSEGLEEDLEFSDEDCRAGIERHQSTVEEVVTNQIHDIAERLPLVELGEILFQCQSAAIEATKAAKPELAAVLIHLAAELIATKNLDTVMGVVTRPSKAIQQLISLSRRDARVSC